MTRYRRTDMYTDHQKLLENFRQLNLKMIKDYYPKYLESLSKNQKSLTEILLELTEKEVEYQAEQKFKRAIKLARFPKIKYLSDFDFTFQPSINKQEILTLKSMHFLEKKGIINKTLKQLNKIELLIIDEIGYQKNKQISSIN